MRCTECKKEVPVGSGYCPYCGTPINPQANPQTNSRANPQMYPLKVRNALGIPVLTFNANGVDFNMVKVEKGSFYRGSSLEEIQYYINRGEDWKRIFPLVTLNTFFIGETAVTQALWEAVMYEKDDNIAYWDSQKGIYNPSKFKGKDLPVHSLGSAEVPRFLGRLNQLTGWEFAMPTNDQWEFAARGGNLSKGYKYAGSNSIGEVAWYRGNSNVLCWKGGFDKENRPRPVKTKHPNELGIYDMSGNVGEFCATPNSWHVDSRGGGFADEEASCQIIMGSSYGYDNGFRLVLNKPAQIKER